MIGLGKTAVALSALEPRHLPALVVAPKRVAENVWHVERDLWRMDLDLRVAAGTHAQRAEVLVSGADVIVIGRDNLSDVQTSFRTLILDELSSFKNRASVRWREARRLIKKSGSPHVWGLTGTPAPNGLLDLWAQIYLLDGGARLGTRLTDYRGRYFVPGGQLPSGVITSWIPRPETDKHVHRSLEDLCLYMESDGRVSLPPLTYNDVAVQLPDPVQKVYRDFKDTLVADLRDVFGGEIHTAANAAVLTSKLSQISAGFVYVDDADIRGGGHTRLHQAKLNTVQEIIDGTGSPVLVFYRFQAELEMLQEVLPQARTIDEPNVISDWNSGEVPVMLAHPASAGHGLNLQHGGHTQIWTTLPWELELWEQGVRRTYRQGQQHPVVVHILMAERTVDHLIRRRLEGKAMTQDALLDHLRSPL